ncbi:hypothetical protein HYPSUDRAFT_106891, partial [Hypholoma sublateritium FD-334 SS-4]
KASEPQIGAINWTNNLVWALLGEIEKDNNYRVLFGKRDPSENTSGERKSMVYKRIAQAVLPDLFGINANTIRDRIKAKIEILTKTYARFATRLCATGEGVTDGDSQSTEKTLDFYISGEGPCVETPYHARNIWNEIEKEFIFFPALHRI